MDSRQQGPHLSGTGRLPITVFIGKENPDAAAPENGVEGTGAADASAALGERLWSYLSAARGAFSGNTERAIRADVEIFSDWCERHGVPALPAQAATVGAFIDAAAGKRAPATVRRYVSSIATLHKAVELDNPSESVVAKLALQRMHRKYGRRQAQVRGLTWVLRQRLVAARGDRPIDARNRALVAVAYDTLLRRSELVSLQVSDILMELDGSASVLVRRGKTDAEGAGAMLFLAPDSVRLVEEWLRRSGVAGGRLFRSVRKNGSLGTQLDASQIPRIYKAMARRAGLPDEVVDGLSGHSPRVGAAQDMIALGIEMPAILQAGRWKSTVMVQRYAERLLASRSGAAQLARLQDRK